ncbi:hypothetical protein [Allorhizocola rhizosphaerae]|uniref:hypothetical protein n=1 Tax=Allorhizocola rhizosphaerae TaxID=1872709 RepID=UPI001B8AAB55|nr:hypothetical protein [Allorhizocola rhizosphaerae]
MASPRLVYGGLEVANAAGTDSAYHALYFEINGSGDLGRVTFEGLDAIRGSRGEHLPFDDSAIRYSHGDWVFTVDGSRWLRERHAYETRHYSTPLLDTHRHYLFVFHDYFVEAIAEGIWFDIADRANPFSPPVSHPLQPFGLDLPYERFTSADGLEWELRRSPRPDADLIRDSRLCSQRVFQFNLLLDGSNKEAASIWIRTINGVLISRMSRAWVDHVGQLERFASPGDFSGQWETYLSGVAERRRQMGKVP